MPNIVLIGPPGAGKGEQSKLLVKYYALQHIAPGHLFRKAIQEQTHLGQQVASKIAQGQLVPDQLVINLVSEQLQKKRNRKKGFLFDGYPRSLIQAKALDEQLTTWEKQVDHVISLQVDHSTILDRLASRAELLHRSDDHQHSIKQRLELYAAHSNPIRTYYERQGKLSSINGLGSIHQVFQRIAKLITTNQ